MSTAETREEAVEGVLLDTQSAAVKKLIGRGKERGYVTVDELNAALPSEQVSSELIEDTMAMLSDIGINVVESEETEEGETAVAKPDEEGRRGGGERRQRRRGSLGRTDDPVRMYLREMGSVELLSREGEIAIAKRIEAGRDMMIGGLCEGPLTFQAILRWHDAVKEGRMLLRDVIDLEATPDPRKQRRTGATARRRRRGGDVEERRREGERHGPLALGARGEAEARGAGALRGDRERLRQAAQDDRQAHGGLCLRRGTTRRAARRPMRSSAASWSALVEKVHLHNNRIEELVDQLKGPEPASWWASRAR